MMAIAKPRHRGGKHGIPLQNRTCSLGAVMITSALFFFLGMLRGTLSPENRLAFTDSTKHDKQSEGVRLLPVYQPYAHGETGDADVDHISFQVLSWSPRAFIFPGFADNDTCDKIIAAANKSMVPSRLALRAGESMEGQENVRTSSGASLWAKDEPSGALLKVEKKMSRVTAISEKQGEAINILRYLPGERYLAHMDSFDPKQFGNMPFNRIASFLLYLSDVEEGGETAFPREGGVERTKRFDECVGLKVKPKKGDDLLFWSMTPERTIDQSALHAGCPVIKGEKWVATKWFQNI